MICGADAPRTGTQEGVRGCQAPDPVPPEILTCPGEPAGAPREGSRDAKRLDPHTSHPPPPCTTMSPDGVLTHGVQRCTATHEGTRTDTSDEDGNEEGSARSPPLHRPHPHPHPPHPEGRSAPATWLSPPPPAAYGGPREADFWKTSQRPGALAHPRAAQEAFDERSAWMD